MDLTIFHALNGLAVRHDGSVEDPMRFFAVEAPVLFIVLLAGLFLAAGKLRSQSARHGVVAAGFSALLALGIAQILNHLWARPRPYVAHPGDAHLFVPATHDTSFPSDHATAAFAIAVAIALRSRRAGWVALALATLSLYHPLARVPLHLLADAAGGIWDSLARPLTGSGRA